MSKLPHASAQGLGGGGAAPDQIAFAANEPVANPGGVTLTIEGNGTYSVAANHIFQSVYFYRDLQPGGLPIGTVAAVNSGIWNSTVTVAVTGTYGVWAELTTTNANGNIFTIDTPTVNLVVN
jgi:hypothetical protein